VHEFECWNVFLCVYTERENRDCVECVRSCVCVRKFKELSADLKKKKGGKG